MEAEIPVDAHLHRDKVMVWEEAQANQLYQRGAYGKPLSGGKLQLAPVEALYLIDGEKSGLSTARRARSSSSASSAQNCRGVILSSCSSTQSTRTCVQEGMS